MTRVRIDLDRAGVRHAALSSPEIRAAVSAAAHRIATAARSKTTSEIVVNDAGRSRARSYVVRLGGGAEDEVEDRALGSSV